MSMYILAFTAFLVGALLGVALARVVRNHGAAKVRLRRSMSAPSGAVIDLIARVEREPELIPFVRSIEVLDRREGSARYRATFGLVFDMVWAAYHKSWNRKKRRVEWRSEGGSLGLSQTGRIEFHQTGQILQVELTTEYQFRTPIFGVIMVMASELLVAAALSAWLRNLDRAAGATHSGDVAAAG